MHSIVSERESVSLGGGAVKEGGRGGGGVGSDIFVCGFIIYHFCHFLSCCYLVCEDVSS